MTRARPRLLRRAFVTLPVFLSACMLGPDYERPELDLPDRWQAALDEPVAGAPPQPIEWWEQLGDPVLDGLIAKAFQQNFTLQEAGLRVVQARAGQASSYWLLAPALLPEASAARAYYSQEVKPDVDVEFPDVDVKAPKGTAPKLKKFLENFLPSVTKDGALDVSIADHVDVYSAGVNALWELDLFGKTRRNIETQTAEVAAAIGAYEAVMVSLAGEVASTYVLVRTAETQLDIAHAHVAALESILGVAEGRSDATSEIDSRLIRVVLLDARAHGLAIERALHAAKGTLCVLLGETPDKADQLLDGRRPIPAVSVEVALGVPADLLRRRPDVRAAEWLVAADCARIGTAVAQAVAPSFKLFGSLGVAASDLSDLGDSDARTGAYGAGVGWNILLYPIMQQRVRVQDAEYERSILRYRGTVLRAIEEVETFTFALRKVKQELPLLQESADLSREAYERSAEGYRRDEVQFPWLMDSIEQRLRQEQRVAAATGDAATRLIAVYRALGGGWEVRDGKPFVPEEIRLRMRETTDWSTFGGEALLEAEVLEAEDA